MNFYECISRINSIHSQYQIALSAFDLYQKNEEMSLLSKMGKWDPNFNNIIAGLKKGKDEKNDWFDEGELKKRYKELSGLTKIFLSYPKQEAKRLKNTMRQNSLIYILSTFEIFLNDLIRHILTQRPGLLKSDRKIEIGRLISFGFDNLIKEEVERQVYLLDRKSIKERSIYFQEHLKLPWGKDYKSIDVIIKSNDIRNNIIHKDTGLTVKEVDLFNALTNCNSVVLHLMIGFMKHYGDISQHFIRQKKQNKTNSGGAKNRTDDLNR